MVFRSTEDFSNPDNVSSKTNNQNFLDQIKQLQAERDADPAAWQARVDKWRAETVERRRLAQAWSEQRVRERDKANEDNRPRAEPEKREPPAHGFRTRAQDKLAPPPTWLIEGLIETNTDAVLYAPTSFLKSFVALDLLYSVATGIPAFGTVAVNDPGPCVYYAGEGHNDVVKRRAPAWEIAHGHDAYSIDDVIFSEQAPIVSDDRLVTTGLQYLRDEFLGRDRQARLVVIDTLNRALAGEDEDRAHTASKYLKMAKKLRYVLGGSTLTVAHKSNKGDSDRGVRGSSAFESGFDTVLEIRRHAKDELTHDHTLELVVKKQKSGEDGQTYYLQSRFVGLPDGGSSLVLDPIDKDCAIAALTAKADNKTCDAGMVETALLGMTDGGYVSSDKLIKTLAKRLDKSETAIQKALSRGLETGELTKFKSGRGQWSLPEIVALDTVQTGLPN